MLIKYIGTTTDLSVDNGFGEVFDLNPGDVFFCNPKQNLHVEQPNYFELVRYGTELIQKKVTISSAQLLALNTTPKTLVSAPGAGYFIDVFSITYSLDYNSVAYATNTTIESRYTNGSGAKVCVDCAALLAATADKVVTVKPDDAELVNVANAAVVAYAPSGNPASGNSPVYATITYRVLPV